MSCSSAAGHSVARLSPRTISAWLPFDPAGPLAALSTPARILTIIFAAATKHSAVSQTLPAVASFSVLVSKAAWSPLDHLPVVVLTDGSLLIACP